MLKRNFKFENRADDKSALQGYAFKFSEVAEGWLGKERFSDSLEIEYNSRVLLLYQHDITKPLARLGSNMAIEKKADGLFFSVSKLPDTQLAKECKELVKIGALSGVSVGFSVLSERKEDKINIFEKIKLFELSLVSFPYYESSEVRNKHPVPPKPPEFYL